MTETVLAVWMDGFQTPAGRLARTSHGDTAFLYDADYVAAGGVPLSLALPVEEEAFGDVETRAFFANLLPENAQLQRIMERHGIARDDVVGLLEHLGADCAGSVSCLPLDAPPIKSPGLLAEDYEPLDDKALLKLVRSLRDERRVPTDLTDPSPVAGVQSKVAVTRLADGVFALPRAGSRVPTTHILKVPARRDARDTRHEEAAAILAAAAGLDVSVPTAIRIGDVDALLIERFDRHVADGIVSRIHQEDFAQALGLPSELKYQRRGQPGRWFDVSAAVSVLDQTRAPAASRLAFLKASIFNLCIGNTDNHAKNHAVLYDAPGAPRFAPLYDLLPIRLSRNFTHELAFQIRAAKHFDEMTTDDLFAFFTEMGVDRADFQLLIDGELSPMIAALEAASPRLKSAGLKSFNDLLGRELEELTEKLHLPIHIEPRDYFPAEGV
ncbi:MAG: HipA domain-containing protein [Brevundimonas sp.]|jgi:serine/threonine-protein kinase HipA|uniref:HipA domain-containing protein n=1 Tax=Brevundimonas sp. TaxID=1871086 RepID=UPI0025BD9253|nr:HipA domain-containing protein [Brevundimonas sp.]MCH4267201.1 HipA domain-containing protein [Brevundimonas sp.]